jgi:hypothetical protein
LNLNPTVGNPGVNQQPAWFATYTADIIVVHENSTWPSEASMEGNFVGGHAFYPPSRRAAMVYNQPTLDVALLDTLRKNVQWVYVNDDNLPNPWDALPSYLGELFAAVSLAGGDAGSGGGSTAWADITGKPATFPPTVPIAWTDISGKPATFAPSAHSHPQSEVTNLVTDLAGKAPTIHTHAQSDITGLPAALTGKEPTIAAGVTAQYWRGDKSWQTLDKAAVGLGNVDNTSDASKPVSTAGATANALRVLKAGDTMTGPLVMPSSGTAAATSINFGTAGAGLYSPTGSTIHVSTGGILRMSVTTASVSTALPLSLPATGTAAATTVFFGAQGTGFYGTTTTLSASTTGVNRLTVADTVITSTVPVALPADAASALHAVPKQQMDAAAALKVAKAGDTMTGDLVIAKANPILTLNKAASGQAAGITGTTNGLARWNVLLGDNLAESGANAGSHFYINRYNDAGTYIDSPMIINRTSGSTVMSGIYANTIVLAHGSGLGGINNVPGISYDQTNNLILEHGETQGLSINRNATNGYSILFLQSAVACGSITVANATSTSFNTTSDQRLKENAEPFDAGPILDATNIYHFKWKNSDATGYGVLAQEAVNVFPDAIFHDEENDTWGADYSKYVPLLLQEIKALRARVAALEAANV